MKGLNNMTPKHTKTPWTLDDYTIKSKNETVAEVNSHIGNFEQIANAEFIVKAVNNHENLVSLLREYVMHITSKDRIEDWENRVIQALKQAESGE